MAYCVLVVIVGCVIYGPLIHQTLAKIRVISSQTSSTEEMGFLTGQPWYESGTFGLSEVIYCCQAAWREVKWMNDCSSLSSYRPGSQFLSMREENAQEWDKIPFLSKAAARRTLFTKELFRKSFSRDERPGKKNQTIKKIPNKLLKITEWKK